MTGQELLDMRVAKGLNQVAIAAESGVAISLISILERDEQVEAYRERIASAIRKMAPGTPKKRRHPKPQAIAA